MSDTKEALARLEELSKLIQEIELKVLKMNLSSNIASVNTTMHISQFISNTIGALGSIGEEVKLNILRYKEGRQDQIKASWDYFYKELDKERSEKG